MDGIRYEAYELRCDIRKGVNMTYAFGVDISKYQSSQNGKILQDFDALANHSEKVSFIFARAGVSWGYKDPCFDYYWSEMARIGVCRGAYHYLYPSQSVQRQMDWFLSIAHNRTEHDRLALDLETTNGLYRQQVTDFLNNCLEYLKQRTGRYPILYSRKTWLDPYVDMRQVPEVDLWIARYASIPPGKKYAPEYPTPPELPNHTHNWLIHQVGDKMPPIGCQSKTMDYDRWNGDESAVRAYFGYDGPIEPPPPPEPPDPTEPLFEGIVTAEPYLNIREYPTTQSADLGDLFPGRRLNVYEIVPNWYRMRTVDEPYQAGWVASAWVKRDWGGGLIETPLFSQLDPRWRYKKLGTSNSTIGSYGCTLTSVAMVCAYYGKQTNPDLLNQAMIRANGYENQNLWRWWVLPAIYPDILLNEFINCESTPAPLTLIDTRLASGIPVIVKVDYYPGGAVQQHWILLCGKQDDDYIAADPISGTRILFREKYGDPARYIFRVVTYVRRKA